jgi:hypothetical protein
VVAGNVARILRGPGRVVIGPTNLAAAYPYGGTEVGKTNQFALQSFGTQFRIESEGLGEATDILEANKRFVAALFVRGWDDDAVEQFFSSSNYAAGGTSAHAVLSEPGTKVPGESAIARAVKLLYVPDDIIHVPSLLIYRGIPDWTEASELAFQRGSELGIPLTIDCLRDGNGNTLSIGMLADLSLT